MYVLFFFIDILYWLQFLFCTNKKITFYAHKALYFLGEIQSLVEPTVQYATALSHQHQGQFPVGEILPKMGLIFK